MHGRESKIGMTLAEVCLAIGQGQVAATIERRWYVVKENELRRLAGIEALVQRLGGTAPRRPLLV